jgi:hypothetical protein
LGEHASRAEECRKGQDRDEAEGHTASPKAGWQSAVYHRRTRTCRTSMVGLDMFRLRFYTLNVIKLAKART